MTAKNSKGSYHMTAYSPRHDLFNKSSENHNQDGGGAQTPQIAARCPEFFSSDIEGYEDDSAPCLFVETGSKRLATYDSSGELSGDGRIVIHDTVICMKYGSWAPIIQQYMFEGKHVKKISIIRFISINGTKVVTQELNYYICTIKTYHQSGDTITFTIASVELEDVKIVFESESGNKTGVIATKFNTGKVKVFT